MPANSKTAAATSRDARRHTSPRLAARSPIATAGQKSSACHQDKLFIARFDKVVRKSLSAYLCAGQLTALASHNQCCFSNRQVRRADKALVTGTALRAGGPVRGHPVASPITGCYCARDCAQRLSEVGHSAPNGTQVSLRIAEQNARVSAWFRSARRTQNSVGPPVKVRFPPPARDSRWATTGSMCENVRQRSLCEPLFREKAENVGR